MLDHNLNLHQVGESLGSNCGSGPGAIGSRSYRFLNASTGMSTPAELITNYLSVSWPDSLKSF